MIVPIARVIAPLIKSKQIKMYYSITALKKPLLIIVLIGICGHYLGSQGQVLLKT